MTWIQTLKGNRFDLLSPSPDLIDPEELAVVLSRICRFGAHCREFYSVAQHSVFVCDLVEEQSLKLPALLHDAHEAYWGFGDICRPAKQLIREPLRHICEAVDSAIAERFGLPMASVFSSAKIKHADNVALATEARDLMEEPPCPWEMLPPPHSGKIAPVSMADAEKMFLARLRELTE